MRLNLDWFFKLTSPPDFQETRLEGNNAPIARTAAFLEADHRPLQVITGVPREKKLVSPQNLHLPKRMHVRLTR
jgi:hypothetical protein